jgi:hypothetical protein
MTIIKITQLLLPFNGLKDFMIEVKALEKFIGFSFR